MLGWHYRSRSESLISFSNWAFYEGSLLTVPEESLPGPNQQSLVAVKAEDAAGNAAELVARPVSFHSIQHGIYQGRRNRAEAEYIAHLVRKLLADHAGLSIGVVAFSEAQQEEIDLALERLAQQDSSFRDQLDAALAREEDGQFVGLLVKNLENMQGDERDVIILSVCYGHGPNGKMLMNFGPINKSGGEKRLNVAFTRAKHHMAIVSSINHSHITNEYNDGANCLKNYLRYAESMSAGNWDQGEIVLRRMSRHYSSGEGQRVETATPLASRIAAALADKGYIVDTQVGQSHFRCDLAVRRPGDAVYRLGILLDDQSHYEQTDLLEREVMRPKLLRAFGWRVAQVSAKDWVKDSEAVITRLLAAIEG